LDAGRNTPRHCALRPLVAPARACGAYRHETRGRHRPPRTATPDWSAARAAAGPR
jgi:hypothetical protein